MKRLFSLLFLLTSLSLSAQETEYIVDFAEDEPQFPGGEAAMIKFIQDNCRYPLQAQANGEHGIVYVQFVVRRTGELTDIKVMKGISDLLDNEAATVEKKMPKWEPGTQKGKKVSCRYTLPIKFTLSAQDQKNAKKELRKQKKKGYNPNRIDY